MEPQRKRLANLTCQWITCSHWQPNLKGSALQIPNLHCRTEKSKAAKTLTPNPKLCRGEETRFVPLNWSNLTPNPQLCRVERLEGALRRDLSSRPQHRSALPRLQKQVRRPTHLRHRDRTPAPMTGHAFNTASPPSPPPRHQNARTTAINLNQTNHQPPTSAPRVRTSTLDIVGSDP